MNIHQITLDQKDNWNDFVAKSAMGSFLQTYEWGELQERLGAKVWRLAVMEENQWVAVIFFYKISLKLGQSMLYAPKGPVFKNSKLEITNTKQNQISTRDIFELLMKEIDKIARQENVLGIQLDPETADETWNQLFYDHNFVKTELDAQPRHTLILDLTKSEDELLANMHSKTRYNINLALKKDVEITVDNTKFKEFWELLKKTEQRQNISLQQETYFKELLELPFVNLYLAQKDGQIAAANVIINWNNTATYLFGASDYAYRNIMAPHLLQWQAIKDAKKTSRTRYDFWGAAPKNSDGREQNWSGFTRFKMGFSPDAAITEYIGTVEKIYKPTQLGIYRFLQKIKST